MCRKHKALTRDATITMVAAGRPHLPRPHLPQPTSRTRPSPRSRSSRTRSSTKRRTPLAKNWQNETSQRLGWALGCLLLGGARGEPPPGSERPARRFLQAQHRFYLERVSFSVQESDAPHLRLSFGRFSEKTLRPSRTS